MTTLAPTVSSTGIDAPTYEDILAYLEVQFKNIYGADAYISADSQDGQLLAVVALAISDANQAIVDVYNSFLPTYAQGTGLSSIVKINGIRRLSASQSTAVGLVVGVTGTVIVAGIVADDNGNLWDLPDTVTIPDAGEISITVTAQEDGDLTAASGTITTIQTPTYGWQTFTSTADASPGSPVESDADLRARQAASTSLPAQTVLEALVAAVANIFGVTRYQVYENSTASTDSNGIPSHSICFVVQGGDTTEIAETIAAKKTPGTGTFGDTEITVYDTYGIPSDISFQILEEVALDLTVTIQTLPSYVTTTGMLLKAALVEFINNLPVGSYSYLNRLWGPANLSGEAAVTSSGLTQAQLDVLSNTYNVLAIAQSRTSNPIDTTVSGGPYVAGVGTVSVADPADIYAGQIISFVLDNAVAHEVRVTGVASSSVSFLPVIPAGRSIQTASNVYLISDIKIAFSEAAICEVADVALSAV